MDELTRMAAECDCEGITLYRNGARWEASAKVHEFGIGWIEKMEYSLTIEDAMNKLFGELAKRRIKEIPRPIPPPPVHLPETGTLFQIPP